MKANYLFITVLAALVSCNKNEYTPAESTPDSFTISIGQVESGDNNTKTQLVEENSKYNKLVWKDGDKLYVMKSSSLGSSANAPFPYAIYTTNNGGSTTATFLKTGGDDIPSTGNFIVMYSGKVDTPDIEGSGVFQYNTVINYTGLYVNAYYNLAIPSAQTYVENGIDTEVMPMYGYGSEGENLNEISMNCLGSIIRLNLYNSDAENHTVKINSIVLSNTDKSKKYYNIAGPYGILTGTESDVRFGDYSDPNLNFFGMWNPIVQGSSSITLNCSSSANLSKDNPTAFNIVYGTTGTEYKADGTTLFSDSSYSFKVSIYYSVNGVAKTNPKEFTLTNLSRAQILKKGKIYSFSAKDTKGW